MYKNFALDEDAWMDEFAVAWATDEELQCVMSDCKTPTESWTPPPNDNNMAAAGMKGIGCVGVFLAVALMWFAL